MDLIDQLMEIVYQHSFQVQPGFFLEHFGSKTLRNEFISETALAGIEKAIVAQGEEEILYAASKEFGYNYAGQIPLPKTNSILKKEYFKSLINFFETTYGRCPGYEVDWENKLIKIRFKNFIVCRKNGVGIFAIATFAGLAAYMFDDMALEGMQTSCEGRGDPECVAVFGPVEKIKESKPFVHSKISIKSLDQRYAAMNRVVPAPADYGLELLTRTGIASYKSSTFDVLGERFFPIEISFIPQLEQMLSEKGVNLQKTIYTPTFAAFKDFAEIKIKAKFPNNQNHLDLLCKMFSAFGWGALQHLDNKIIVRGFPWTDLAMKTPVPQYFMGSVDGFLSGLTGKNIKTKLVQAETGSGNYTLVLTPQ